MKSIKLLIFIMIVILTFTGCSNEIIEEQIDTNIDEHETSTMEIVSEQLVDDKTVKDTDSENIYPEATYAKVFASKLNVRNKASIDGEILTYIDINTIVEILGEFKDSQDMIWYRIKLDGYDESWIASNYCKSIKDNATKLLDYKIIDPSNIVKTLDNSYYIEFNIVEDRYNYILDFDLNNDDVNEKIFFLPQENDNMLVEYNDKSFEIVFNYNGLLAFGIIDIDSNDEYYDIYFLSDYAVAPHAIYNIYRFNADKFEEIASLNSLIVHLDGSGKIYYWGGQLFETYNDNFNYDLVMEHFDINSNQIVKNNDAIGKTFTIDYNGVVVFKEHGFMYDNVWEQMDWLAEEHKNEYLKILESGDTFTLLAIGEDENDYQIKLEDGRTGWVTGFHFYID